MNEYAVMRQLSEETSADWYGVTEEVAWEIDAIFDKADAQAYLALYRPDDKTVDRDAARKDFDALCAKLGGPELRLTGIQGRRLSQAEVLYGQ